MRHMQTLLLLLVCLALLASGYGSSETVNVRLLSVAEAEPAADTWDNFPPTPEMVKERLENLETMKSGSVSDKVMLFFDSGESSPYRDEAGRMPLFLRRAREDERFAQSLWDTLEGYAGGEYSTKIWEGEPTVGFPECVVLVDDADEPTKIASGVYIGHRLVLTAAHSFYEGFDTQVVHVGFGHSLSNLSERYIQGSAIIHESYSHDNDQNDMALIVLDYAPRTVQPVSLADSGLIDSLENASVSIVGFGLDHNCIAGVKQHAKVLTTTMDCDDDGTDLWNVYACYAHQEVVAAEAFNPDTCFGDSGGPMYSNDAKSRRVVGITSRGVNHNTHCGDGAIYVRADCIQQWLDKQTTQARVSALLNTP